MRVIYNVTLSIDPACELEWVEWMTKEHIPAVMATGTFAESRFSRLNGEEDGAATYAATYLAYSQELLDEYATKHAPKLQADVTERFAGRFAAFRTTLNELAYFSHEG